MGSIAKFERGMELTRRGVTKPCLHRAVALNARERQAVCRGCGKILDPFECLLMYADMGRREAQRLPDAEEADALIRELLYDHRGRLTISKRGIVAVLKANRRQVSSQAQAQWLTGSVFATIRQVIRQALDKARWTEGRKEA